MLRDFIKTSMEKKNTVMFITSLVFITGIASYFNNSEFILAIILTMVSAGLVWANKLSYKLGILWIIVFYLGFFNAHFRIHNTDELAGMTPFKGEITGRISSIPNISDGEKAKFFFNVKTVGKKTVKGNSYVNIAIEDNKNFNIGDVYKINDAYLNEPFKATNPSQFDYGKYLRNFDTFTVIYAKDKDCTKINEELPLKWRFMQRLNDVRNDIIKVHSQYLKSPNLEILGGIVFGDDAVAPPDYIKASFVNSGLLHILAASGMNVAFIFGFWFWIMSMLKMPYKPRVMTGMGVIILYTLMTGLGASVIRAALMLLFVLAGKLINRDSHSISLLSFVAMLMLIYNPAYINDVGFQLSFIVTFGIICTANVLIEKFRGNRVKEYIAGAILIPMTAQIWVMPIQMFYFNTISTYSLFANVAIMPFLSVISFGGFVSSVLAMIKPIANIVCFISDSVLNLFLNVLVAISNFFSHMPHSLIFTTHPSFYQIILYYLIVILATLMIKLEANRRNWISLGVMIIFLVLSTIPIKNNRLEIITFDVGNADAFLVKTPQNKYVAIDTGKSGYNGGKSQAEYIILKYMRDKGIKNLEALVITHFDNDHSGGAVDMMKNLKVKEVYINSKNVNSKTSNEIMDYLNSGKQDFAIARNDNEIYSESGLTIKTYIANLKTDNENSIITLLKYKDFEMLFMGDAGIEAFRKVSADFPGNIEVFKAGHHGAANVADKDLIEKINPAVSVISTGKNNYGHPNKATLDVLRHSDIYRTDRNNSIKIATDGCEYLIQTYDSIARKYIMTDKKSAK